MSSLGKVGLIYYNYELVCGSQRIDSGRFQLNRAQDA